MGNTDPIRAIILAGGRGTRLRPYTMTLPKPLVPVGDRPILDIVMEQLRNEGVTRITIAVNHLAELIMAYFADGARYGIEIDYSREFETLGTIGPLRLIPDLPDNFIVMNGDILTDLSYGDFFKAHVESGAIASVAIYTRTTKVDFGVLETDSTGYLSRFVEKPTYEHSVSMGVYAFNRNVLKYVPDSGPFGFDHLMLALLAAKVPVRCQAHPGKWLDIGRPDDYEQAQNFLL